VDLQDPEGMFEDPWNPTPVEIRRWAHSDTDPPEQDWELAIDRYPSLLIELIDDPSGAADARCFLLRALYVYAGDKFRSGRSADSPDLSELFTDASARGIPLKRWVERTRQLFAGELPYSSDNWGLGGRLAREDCDLFKH